MSAADPLLRLVVYGIPRTAGSKDALPVYAGRGDERYFTGKINVAEKDPHGRKRSWRKSIVDDARALVACGCEDPHCTVLRPPFPLDEPLVMSMVFTVTKPGSARKTIQTWPVARPDLLKYARAAEDALTAAGVLKDDARVVEYARLAKVYPGEDEQSLSSPGMLVLIWRRSLWPGLSVAATDPSLLYTIVGAS